MVFKYTTRIAKVFFLHKKKKKDQYAQDWTESNGSHSQNMSSDKANTGENKTKQKKHSTVLFLRPSIYLGQ